MLILGLGNPGRQYEGTRHNVGFAVIDELGRRYGIALDRQRHRALCGRGRIGATPVVLAKPMTYMNLSGEAARPLLAYHGLEAGDLIVVHDEADLPPGVVRVKSGGGLAGHKGLVSIAAHLGTRDFRRVRIGIGRPEGGGEEMSEHVLHRPGGEEGRRLAAAVDEAADAVESILSDGIEDAMGRFNRRQTEPPA